MLSFLRCPEHGEALREDGGDLVCPRGCRHPVRSGVPRFVEAQDYAASFGLQWRVFAKTQLDSYTGTSITADRLSRCLGGSLEVVKDKLVVEAGCGAGRFTEVLLAAGAKVIACDLSLAVDANQANNGGNPRCLVCQADLRRLPVAQASADVVLCLGVVQHTPDPEGTIQVLCSYVKPGGMVALDHYSHNYPVTPSRKLLRRLLTRMGPEAALKTSMALTRALWPLHTAFKRHSAHHRVAGLRWRFLRWSPVVDYHDAFPELDPAVLKEWALLDTHDTLTDTYKHLRDDRQIAAALRAAGMVDIHSQYAGNGVEARARKPLPGERA